MTTPLHLPSKQYSADQQPHSMNDRALEIWARDAVAALDALEAAPPAHGASHALDGTDPATAFPIFQGHTRAAAATWSNAAADGYEDWGGSALLSLTFTKKLAGSRLLVTVNYSLYISTGGGNGWSEAIDIGGTKYGVATKSRNVLNDHAHYGGQILIAGIAAGSRTAKLMLDSGGDTINTDASDAGDIVVWEVPA